jgi:voltage-gated potassium channel
MAEITASDRIDWLRAVPLFAGVSDEGLHRLLAVVGEHEVPAGYVLIEADRPGSGLFVIESGTVVVERPGGPIELGAGEFLGELALLYDGAVHALRVRAATPVRFLALARDELTSLLESEPRVALAMLQVLARRLWHATR